MFNATVLVVEIALARDFEESVGTDVAGFETVVVGDFDTGNFLVELDGSSFESTSIFFPSFDFPLAVVSASTTWESIVEFSLFSFFDEANEVSYDA